MSSVFSITSLVVPATDETMAAGRWPGLKNNGGLLEQAAQWRSRKIIGQWWMSLPATITNRSSGAPPRDRFFNLSFMLLLFVFVTQLCYYADKNIVNIMKMYVERNNLQLEFIRCCKNVDFIHVYFCEATCSMQPIGHQNLHQQC